MGYLSGDGAESLKLLSLHQGLLKKDAISDVNDNPFELLDFKAHFTGGGIDRFQDRVYRAPVLVAEAALRGKRRPPGSEGGFKSLAYPPAVIRGNPLQEPPGISYGLFRGIPQNSGTGLIDKLQPEILAEDEDEKREALDEMEVALFSQPRFFFECLAFLIALQTQSEVIGTERLLDVVIGAYFDGV